MGMTSSLEPRITSAERLDGGIIVHFSDGRTAIYSSSLLLSFLDQAELVLEPDPTEE
jgi:hypothetical protein